MTPHHQYYGSVQSPVTPLAPLAINNFDYNKCDWDARPNPFTFTLGFTPTVGRLLVAAVAYYTPWNFASTYPVITQAGATWVNIIKTHRNTSGNTENVGVAMLYSFVPGVVSTSVSVAYPSPATGDGGQRSAVAIYEITGVRDPSPTNRIHSDLTPSSMLFAAPTTVADTIWIALGHGDTLDVGGTVSPGGWVEDVDDFLTQGTLDNGAVKVSSKIFSAISNETVVHTYPGGFSRPVGVMVAFRKAT